MCKDNMPMRASGPRGEPPGWGEADGMLGIDRAARRSAVHRVLRLLIAIGYVALAAMLGIVASHYLPIGVAILLAAGAALLIQPAQSRLEPVADRWAFSTRLDGYEVVTRLGAMLETAPGSAELLPKLADTIREGLCLRWARVRLDVAATAHSRPLVGSAGIGPEEVAEPALELPLVHASRALGRIECGHREDGPFLRKTAAC
jgi:hypothetical protein